MDPRITTVNIGRVIVAPDGARHLVLSFQDRDDLRRSVRLADLPVAEAVERLVSVAERFPDAEYDYSAHPFPKDVAASLMAGLRERCLAHIEFRHCDRCGVRHFVDDDCEL